MIASLVRFRMMAYIAGGANQSPKQWARDARGLIIAVLDKPPLPLKPDALVGSMCLAEARLRVSAHEWIVATDLIVQMEQKGSIASRRQCARIRSRESRQPDDRW
jgi:hypothetical protein